MQLTRPLAAIDLESTGVDPVTDRIIEFGVDILDMDGTRRQWSARFNPGIPIPPEATEIHGIRDEDVKDCPPFSEWAPRIAAGLAGKDLLGYNLWRMDLPLLDEEFRRAGGRLDLEGVRVIDAYRVFAKKEPRALADAVMRYCGRSHADAHGAQADASATVDVLHGQLAAYADLAEMDLDKLAGFCLDERKPADVAGKLYIDAAGDIRYAFGKHRDERVMDNKSYARWMLDKGNFPGSTCDVLRQLLS